ncbi:hypothetical protein LTR53_006864 [Teratosphaeriaceae sp. CCFEE 6253]|nr:hypothetical protein LTR53_006864 [Teratosphaeriaceae sp. CCFEE 6253]
MNAAALSIGQRVELNDNRIASIRFLGPTHFQTGDWVGVELDEATGKNDGSVKGERYFDVEPDHGMFLRPGGIKRVLEPPKPKGVSGVTSRGSSRPSSVHAGGVNGVKRQAVAEGPGRRGSVIGGSPTPSARLATGARSPTKQLASNGTSSTSTSRTNTPPGRGRPGAGPAARSRPSIAPPAASTTSSRRLSTLPSSSSVAAPRPPRPSLAPSSSSTNGRPSAIRSMPSGPAAPHPPASRLHQEPRISSTTEETAEDDDDDDERSAAPSPSPAPALLAKTEERDVEEEPVKPSFAPPPIPPEPPDARPGMRSRRPSSPSGASIHSQRTMRSTTASNRQIEELEAKVRLLERKRTEDRDLRKSLEQAQKERDQYKSIIEKLQNKYRPQQQELTDLKHALAESEQRFVDTETLQAEHDSVMELATLDREMAEEKAESLEAELEALRTRHEETELELEILRDENGELSKEMSPAERTSTGWLQIERSNERLRDALLRLRDLTQDKEAELRAQLADLAAQAQAAKTLRTDLVSTHDNLLRSDAVAEDLRQQLDAALQSDDIIEELTERNQALDAHLASLRQTVEELEDLRDINDELQINYSEQEKQFQEEVDFKDSLLHDRERSSKQQQDALDDADVTLQRYRALVATMQGDLADLHASQRISASEARELGQKSRAVLDANLRLRSSAAATQVKTLDLELRRLEAREAGEHLAIVQLYLPEGFAREERDSVLALLRFRRIAFKAHLVRDVVRERIAAGEAEDAFAACEVLDRLAGIAGLAERFAGAMAACSPEAFVGYEGVVGELEPVERGLNGYLEGLGRGEMGEGRVAGELGRSAGVLEHLAGLYLGGEDSDREGDGGVVGPGLAEEWAMRTGCLQGRMDGVATALGVLKGLVETHVKPAVRGTGDEDGDGEDEEAEAEASELKLVLDRAESLVQSARNAKVMAGKTHRALADLQARDLTLSPDHMSELDGIEDAAALVSRYMRHAGTSLQTLFGEEGRTDPFTPHEVTNLLSRAATSVFDVQAQEAGPFAALATRLRALQDTLSDLAALPTDLDHTVEFTPTPAPPWVARAEALRITKATSVDTQAELDRALEALRERGVVLKGKEAELEEQSVRVEMLEARLREAGKRSARIAELERVVHEAKDEAVKAKSELGLAREAMGREVERVREEMGRLREEGGGGGEVESGEWSGAVKLLAQRQEVKIGNLQGAGENQRLRLPAADSPLAIRATLDWLHAPLAKAKNDKTKRQDALKKEGREVLHRMLELAAKPTLVDLTKMPENRLAWRAKKEVPGWQVASRREEWAALKGWGDDVVARSVTRVVVAGPDV